MEIDEQAHGTEVSVPAGGSLAVRLVENPTTGFRWAVIQDGEPSLALLGDEALPAAGPPGAGGCHRWTFEARLPGSGSIELVYRRAWETTSVAPAQTFQVDIRVV